MHTLIVIIIVVFAILQVVTTVIALGLAAREALLWALKTNSA